MITGSDIDERPRFKVCCIASIEEADLAIGLGASAIGLVSHMPSGPGVIPDELIEEIAASVPAEISTFLLTSSLDAPHIIRQQERFQPDTLQLCDTLPPSEIHALRDALPDVTIVQVVHVVDEGAIAEAAAAEATADALLLDSGNPSLSVKELGGTGKTHDWTVSRRICGAVDIPVILAGGLTPDNVSEAIQVVRPYGVDVCSGVRTRDRLDPEKLTRFVRALGNSIP